MSPSAQRSLFFMLPRLTDTCTHRHVQDHSDVHLFSLIFTDQFISVHVTAALGLIQVDIYIYICTHTVSGIAVWSQSQTDNTNFRRHILGVDGEGNGNPLQYSCLETPMDGGAW